jgi:hypothetical protein
MSGGGMHHHSRGLVHDDNIAVFVHDIQSKHLRFRRAGLRRQLNRDLVAESYLHTRFGW